MQSMEIKEGCVSIGEIVDLMRKYIKDKHTLW